MFFLFASIAIIIAIIVMMIFSNFEIEVKNLKFSTENKVDENMKSNCQVLVRMYILRKLKILELDLTKINLKRKRINLKKIQNKVLKEQNMFDIKMLKILKELKLKIKSANINIDLGLEDAALTAILVGIISSGLAIVLKFSAEEKGEIYFDIKPVYQNKNILNLSFEGIFTLKMIHIINTYRVLIRERSENKNVRTSNRRTYAYNNG